MIDRLYDIDTLTLPERIAGDRMLEQFLNNSKMKQAIKDDHSLHLFNSFTVHAENEDVAKDFFKYLYSIRCPYTTTIESFNTEDGCSDGCFREFIHGEELAHEECDARGRILFNEDSIRNLIDTFKSGDMEAMQKACEKESQILRKVYPDWKQIHHDEKLWEEIDNLRIAVALENS